MINQLNRKLRNLSKWDKVYLFCMCLSLFSAITEISGLYDLKCDRKEKFKTKYKIAKTLYFVNLILIMITYWGLSKTQNDSYILNFCSLLFISIPYAISSMVLSRY